MSKSSDGPVEEEADAILFPWFAEVVGVVVLFLLTRFEIPIPFAAVMFVFGTFLGVGAVKLQSSDKLTRSILMWSEIDSELLLLVFLPGLIFRDAIEVDFNLFAAAFSQILLLAFPVVLFGTILTACAAYYILTFAWPFSLSMTLGSILAATDPIAVAAVLKKLGAPPRLQMHIAGESLLNDGCAVVLYCIFSRQFFAEAGFDEPITVGEGINLFFRMVLGGVVVGLAFAAALIFGLNELDRRLEPEYNILQVVAALSAAYLSYYIADGVLEMSGMIACVTTGVACRALGTGLIKDEQLMDAYLKLMEWVLNTLMFTLGGVVWGSVLARSKGEGYFEQKEWGYLVLVYVLVLAIRFVQVATCYPIFSRIGLKSNWQEAVFISFGGLRGAVGVALSVALCNRVRDETEDPTMNFFASSLVFISGGITLFTLLVNGTSAGPVLKCLNLAKPVMSRKRALQLFEAEMASFVQEHYQHLILEPRFHCVKSNIVQQYLPFATKLEAPRRMSLRRSSLLPLRRAPILRLPEEYARGNPLLFEDDDIRKYDEYLRVVSVRRERTCSKELFVQVRDLFLEMVSDAYKNEDDDGEFIAKDGFTLGALTQSVEFALDDVDHHNKPIQDWHYTELLTNPGVRLWRLATCWRHRSLSAEEQQRLLECQILRTKLRKALAFISAHREAQRTLLLIADAMPEAWSDGECIGKAIETVLEESRCQVECARKVLSSFPLKALEHFVSLYVASILLQKLVKVVEQNNHLLTKEARLYMEKIDIALAQVIKEEERALYLEQNEETHLLTGSEIDKICHLGEIFE